MLTFVTFLLHIILGNTQCAWNININPDGYPSDIGWIIKEVTPISFIETVIDSQYPPGTVNNRLTSNNINCDGKCYVLELYDTYGDGWCCRPQGNGDWESLLNGAVVDGSLGKIYSAPFLATGAPGTEATKTYYIQNGVITSGCSGQAKDPSNNGQWTARTR